MTTTTERYTADPLVEEALWMFERAGDDGDKLYVKAIRTRLQSLEAENARLLKVVELVANFSDRTHMDKLQVIWHLQAIARNALKED